MNLPYELRTNIIEYGSGQHTFKISDIELIERIKLYDPSFDYKKWQTQIAIKNKFINRMKNNPLLELKDYIQKNKLELDIGRQTIYVFPFPLGTRQEKENQHIINIHEILNRLGYDIEIIREEDNNLTYLSVQNIQRLSYNLISLWFYEESIGEDGVSYNMMHNRLNPLFGIKKRYYRNNLINIVDSYDIPVTLSRYLRYIIKKHREEQRIKKNTFYNLYNLLQSYKWTYHERGETDHHILGIEEEDSITDIELANELHLLFGKDNIEVNSGYPGFQYNIYYNKPIDLLLIDKFYHPYIITSFNSFF